MKPPTLPITGRRTDKPDADCYVLGGDHLAEVVARRLQADGHAVALVDDAADSTDLDVIRGDPADVSTLASANVADASTVVVATPDDARNLLVAQLVRVHFDVPRILVVTNEPDGTDSLVDAGHESVCATTTVADTIAREL